MAAVTPAMHAIAKPLTARFRDAEASIPRVNFANGPISFVGPSITIK
jgi:hypothetical protein